MLLTTNFEMTDRRRPKVVPRAATDFVRQLKNWKLPKQVFYLLFKKNPSIIQFSEQSSEKKSVFSCCGISTKAAC